MEDNDRDDLERRVILYNSKIEKKGWPKLVYDKGWLYGVWYCPRAFQKQKYYGQYPLTYLERVRYLFGDLKPLVHLFSGIVSKVDGEITVDNNAELLPDYCNDSTSLPFDSESISCIVADPPYSQKDAINYKCGVYPNMRKTFLECSRVLKDRGYLLMLHTHLLSVPRGDLKLRGTIGVLTGTNAVCRILAIYRKEKSI